MTRVNNIILVVTVLCFSASAFADADFVPPAQPTASSTGARSESSATTTPTQAPSINPSANMGQGSQSSGAALNMVVSAALFTACLAPRHNIWPLCAMGALAAMQAAHDSGAAGMSADTLAASSQDTNTNPGFGTGGGSYTDPKVTEGMKALTNAGYTVTDTGIKNPDGSTTPASAFSSPGAMAAAGMDQSTIALAQKALASADASALDRARVSSVGVAEGSGGAGGASGNYDENDGGNSASGAFGRRNPFSINGDQKRQLVAGKTVMFDGEPIGVKGQDLFNMVHVAYQRKAQGNNFIGATGLGGPAAPRGPASVVPANVIAPARAASPIINNR